MHGLVARRQPGPAAQPRLLDLHRDQSVDLSRHRPRQGAGAGPRDQRRLHRAAGDAGRLLRQQLQPVRPHLAGEHPGRGRRPPPTSTTSGASRSATARRDGAAALDRRAAHRGRAAGHHPLQQLPLDHRSTARPAPGVSSGERWRRWRKSRPRRCRRATASNGPAPPTRNSGRPGRPASSSRWRCCSPTCSWWRCTRAGPSRCRCCCRWRWACSAPSSAS